MATRRVLADTIDGQPIGKVNFVLRDSKDRLWVTISTKFKNWMHALRTDLKDGYIACYEDGAVSHCGGWLRFHQRDPIRRQGGIPLCCGDNRRMRYALADG